MAPPPPPPPPPAPPTIASASAAAPTLSPAANTAAASSSPAVDEFRAGLTACLRSWSALRTAAEAGWGGGDSLAKAEALRSSLLEQHFTFERCPVATLSLCDLEDGLAVYMEEEFSLVLEDGSEREVAAEIWRLYEACYRGDRALALGLVEAAQRLSQLSASLPAPRVRSTEHDDDDNDSDDATDDEEGGDVDMMDAEPDGSAAGAPLQPPPRPAPAFALAPGAGGEGGALASAVSAREYAAQPLFGPVRKRRPRDSQGSTAAVRQLGQAAMPAAPQVPVHEDGFAPVVSSRSRKGGRRAA
jgi:pre-rRNA-processing protein TSR2